MNLVEIYKENRKPRAYFKGLDTASVWKEGSYEYINLHPYVFIGTKRPENPITGQIYLDPATHSFQIYDGNNWFEMKEGKL
jgi:hypothetical protein